MCREGASWGSGAGEGDEWSGGGRVQSVSSSISQSGRGQQVGAHGCGCLNILSFIHSIHSSFFILPLLDLLDLADLVDLRELFLLLFLAPPIDTNRPLASLSRVAVFLPFAWFFFERTDLLFLLERLSLLLLLRLPL